MTFISSPRGSLAPSKNILPDSWGPRMEYIQLRDRVLSDADNQRLLDGIGRQHDCGLVLLFLERPEIEPTNNRAERGLGGAVIARKVSHCSKNERGAGIYEAMKTVTATLALRGHRVPTALAISRFCTPLGPLDTAFVANTTGAS